jgi:hypothetical protein
MFLITSFVRMKWKNNRMSMKYNMNFIRVRNSTGIINGTYVEVSHIKQEHLSGNTAITSD